MSFELRWLIYTVLLTSLLWVPYILNRIAVRGLLPAVGNPSRDDKPHSPWAERAMKAHVNAVENLVLFAPLALAVHVLGASTSTTRGAVVIYFLSRLAHYLIFVAGIPVLRTLSFAASIMAILALGLSLLGVI